MLEGGEMNLAVLQIQALSRLLENVETMIDLYWDTENGAKLNQSLKAFRAASADISLGKTDCAQSMKPRLIVDAHCPSCGFLNDRQQADGLFNISLAVEHTSVHGHVVILNGTTDILPDQELRLALTAGSASDSHVS